MKNQRPLKVDYKFLEALGYLASAPEQTGFGRRFIEDKGLVKTIGVLNKLGMIDSSGPEQAKYKLNQRGREYVMFVLTAACAISNQGVYQPRYEKGKNGCALGVVVDTFDISNLRIEIKS